MTDEAMDGLPDVVREAMAQTRQEPDERLSMLGRAIAAMRDEAVTARKNSGIEQVWMECEEAYLGIDDENRAEWQGAKWAKPLSMEGGLQRERFANSSDQVKATAFVTMTARYVDAGTAKVCEIALPIDGKPFTLKATPVPEGATEDPTPAQNVTGQPMPGPDGQPVTVGQLAQHAATKAEKAAAKAANRIHDWMVEGKHQAEMRKCIFDMARIGVAVLKGPIPEERTARVVRRKRMQDASIVEVVQQTKIKPTARWVDPWNFYPAPGCGEDIHAGGHCFEADPMLEHELLALGKLTSQHYIPEAIMKVIDEGPGKCYADSDAKDAERTKKQYELWHFHGSIKRAEFESANPTQAAQIPEDQERVFVMATLVNDTVIRAVLMPLESQKLPYKVASWRRRLGHWAGRGVAEQIRTPQRIVNAATRALLNNAGKSAGAQVVMDPTLVEAANKDMRISGADKLWFVKEGQAVDDVRKVFAAFNWPNTTPQLMQVIEYAFKLAEENSNIPLVTQGQSGKTTPDTFGGQQLQDNNANQLLRDVGFCLNDQITAPLVDDYYDWLLEDPDVPDDEKGDYQVDTSGALALIEKAIQDMTILQMGGMVLNPAFGLNPERYAEAWLRSKRLVPSDFQFTAEEKQRMAEAPKPKEPTVEAAEIRAKATLEAAAMDRDRDTMHLKAQTERTAMERQSQVDELMIRREIALLNYANQRAIALDQAKKDLALGTMEMNLQRELAGKDGKGPQVADPVVEPEGRAPEGMAYQA